MLSPGLPVALTPKGQSTAGTGCRSRPAIPGPVPAAPRVCQGQGGRRAASLQIWALGAGAGPSTSRNRNSLQADGQERGSYLDDVSLDEQDVQQYLAERLVQQSGLDGSSSASLAGDADLDLEFSLQGEGEQLEDRRSSSGQASTSQHGRAGYEDQQWQNRGSTRRYQRQHTQQGSRQYTQQPRRHEQWHSSAGHRGSQGQQGGTQREHDLDDRALMRLLSKASTLQALSSLCTQHMHRFNHLHVACAINRLAKVPEALQEGHAHRMGALLNQLEELFVAYLPSLSAREVANGLWAWGKLRHWPRERSMQAVLGAIQADGGAMLQGPACTPQALTNMAWGLCQLRCKDEETWANLTQVIRRSLGRQRQQQQQQQAGDGQGSRRRQWEQQDGDADSSSSYGRAQRHGGSGMHAGGPASGASAWSPKDLAVVAWAFATARQYDVLLFHDLASTSISRLEEFCPQDLSNLLWACATAHHPYRPLFEAAAPAVLGTLPGFTPQSLANTLWAYTCSGVVLPELFGAIARQACRCLDRLQPCHMAQMAWALAKAKQVHPALLKAMAGEAACRPEAFKSKELAVMLWALASSKLDAPEVYAAVAHAMLMRMGGAASQQQALAHGSSGYAAEGLDSGVLQEEEQHADGQAGSSLHGPLEGSASFNAQDIANATWAYAMSGMEDQGFFNSVVELCMANRSAWLASPQSFQGTVWSLGYAGQYHPELYEAAAQHLPHAVTARQLTLAQAAAVLLPLAQMRHYSADACSAVAAAVRQALGSAGGSGAAAGGQAAGSGRGGSRRGAASSAGAAALAAAGDAAAGAASEPLNHTTLANILWCLAVLGHFDGPLFKAGFLWVAKQWQLQPAAGMHRSSSNRDHGGSGRGLFSQGPSTSFASQGSYDDGGLEQEGLFSGAAGMGGPSWDPSFGSSLHGAGNGSGTWQQQDPLWGSGMGRKQQGQYYQVYLWLQDLAASGNTAAAAACKAWPRDMLSCLESAWREQAERQSCVSSFQAEVHSVLADMGLQPRMECMTQDRLFSIDMAVTVAGQLVAIEANGPSHYTSTLPRRLLGNKVLRDAFLRARGCEVLNVPWWQWQQLRSDGTALRQYLRSALEEVLSGAGAESGARSAQAGPRSAAVTAGDEEAAGPGASSSSSTSSTGTRGRKTPRERSATPTSSSTATPSASRGGKKGSVAARKQAVAKELDGRQARYEAEQSAAYNVAPGLVWTEEEQGP